tara:strand:- start:271 stop:1083 length:813 start_codon:yes stop_codon:yes gene_type:complete
MKLPKYLKLHLEGGIGDCIKVITCNFPLQSLYNNYGIQTFVTYGGEHYNDCGWEKILQTELLDLCKPFIYVNREVFAKINCPTVSDFFRQPKPFSVDTSKNLPLELTAEIKEPAFGKRNIGIQLDSNDGRKKFSLDKWNLVINKILKQHKNTNIYLFGAPSERGRLDKAFEPNDRLHNTCGNTLAQSLKLMSKMNLFISPDSFSKYVCLCENVPAILLCAELSYMTVKDMLETCFKNIYKNDNFKILGLDPTPVRDINNISVDAILSHIP